MITESAYTTLDRIASIADKTERRIALREACLKRNALAIAIQYAYHPLVVFDLPAGDLPASMFKRSNHDDYSMFYTQLKKLRNFCTVTPHIPSAQKLALFCGLCSDVSPQDATLLIAMKDKKLPWKTLNKSFCVKALAELFPQTLVDEQPADAEVAA